MKKTINKSKLKEEKLPNLDESVLAALKLFIKERPNFPNKLFHAMPIIVGSGNAYNAGQVIFRNQAAVFANESNVKKILKEYKVLISKKLIKEALIISASGEKDSVWEIVLAKKIGLILKDRQLIKKMGENALKLVREKYNWKEIVQKLEKIYDENLD